VNGYGGGLLVLHPARRCSISGRRNQPSTLAVRHVDRDQATRLARLLNALE
jgi:hypothetical protein